MRQHEEAAWAPQRKRVKQEEAAQRAQEAADGLEVGRPFEDGETVDLTETPPRPRHLPDDWERMDGAARQAWVYEWHHLAGNRGDRLCPVCYARQGVKYILKTTRSGGSQFTCNSISCRVLSCNAEYCLTCGQTKEGGRSSGYHSSCGRQPSWLKELAGVPGLSNDDDRVQRPPPLLRREL